MIGSSYENVIGIISLQMSVFLVLALVISPKRIKYIIRVSRNGTYSFLVGTIFIVNSVRVYYQLIADIQLYDLLSDP